MRKIAILALIVMVGGATLHSGVSRAQSAPGAMASPAMASSLSQSDRDSLMKKLHKAKKQFVVQRKYSSQYPTAQGAYDTKIKQIDGLMDKLKNGQDFPLSDVDYALKKPEAAEH